MRIDYWDCRREQRHWLSFICLGNPARHTVKSTSPPAILPAGKEEGARTGLWKSSAVFNEICRGLVSGMERKRPAGSSGAQSIISRHYEWMKQFWTPTRESYAGHSELIVDSDLRKAYEAHHPQLPEFAAAAMKVFAECELSGPTDSK